MDPISDMIAQIKNAILNRDKEIDVVYSRFKGEILKILVQNNFIKNYKEKTIEERKYYHIELNYNGKISLIKQIKRISKPGLRRYVNSNNIPRPLQGIATVIISTPEGVMDGVDAKRKKLGGEVVCIVY